MPIGNSVMRCFRNVVRDSQERTLWGTEFHMVGADTRKEREPNWRLVRGTCGEVLMRKSVVTAGKGKVVNRFSRLRVFISALLLLLLLLSR